MLAVPLLICTLSIQLAYVTSYGAIWKLKNANDVIDSEPD